MFSEIEKQVQDILPEVIAFRHDRHRQPELTWQEVDTAKVVAAELEKIPGIEVSTGIGRLGVVGLLEGASPGPVVGLRADMDALPIDEKTGVSYASENQGVMHACGHDGHMANLLGAAKVLSQHRDKIAGKVKFIFQPAEEGGAGALAMCDDGVLDDPKVDVIFGLHGWPEQRAGKIFVKAGPLMASQTVVKFSIRGRGGHAALPHLSTDQVLIGSRLVAMLQDLSARYVAPTEPIALTISKFHGGTATNVIPDVVELAGTLRAVTIESRDNVLKRIAEVASGLASTYGVEIDFNYELGYPPTINHEKPSAFVAETARRVIGEDAVDILAAPTMGAEDFSYFLERVPGCYFFLGVDDGRTGGYPSLHHPGFDFNDAALPIGIRLFVHLALDWAGRHT